MAQVTVTGGVNLNVSLNPAQAAAAQAAIAALDAGAPPIIFTTLNATPENGFTNIFDITPTQGGSYSLPQGAQALVLSGTADATLNGGPNATNELLVGNNGNDTVNTFGGSGTVIVGSGNNTINVNGGVQNIQTGPGQDTINLNGGQVNISGSGQDTVNVAAGTNSTVYSTTDLTINLGGNDTITVGSGNDTVNATGNATVAGGSGDLVFNGGVNSTVYAGSGNETLFGGTGATTFYGSSANNGADSMVGGSGTNFFQGGNSRDTMVSGAGIGASSDIFQFASSVPGGNHTIQGFTSGKDEIDLVGYNSATDPLATDLKYSGANSIISLSDGTTITVKGVHVTATDIKYH